MWLEIGLLTEITFLLFLNFILHRFLVFFLVKI